MKYTTAERNALILEVMPTIRSVARRYVRQDDPMFADLVQHAVCALLVLFERFDPARGLARNFAWSWSRQTMQRHLREHGRGRRHMPIGAARYAVTHAASMTDAERAADDRSSPEDDAAAREALRLVARCAAPIRSNTLVDQVEAAGMLGEGRSEYEVAHRFGVSCQAISEMRQKLLDRARRMGLDERRRAG